jgi:hypothetical protein
VLDIATGVAILVHMSNTTTAPATLNHDERGVSIPAHLVAVGDYMWHRGAYRLVTFRDVRWGTIRMGRYVVNHWHGLCEIAQ